MTTTLAPEWATEVLVAVWALQQERRIAALVEIAEKIRVARPAEWDRAVVRSWRNPQPKPNACFACWTTSRRLYWHHIIPVDHGGDNDPWNLVAICNQCHRAIHPWLDEDTAFEAREGPYPAVAWIKAKLARLRWFKGGRS